ncbi:unnamed protein product [Mytilus coruscus]|uniref:Integrase catalytic domain-containing protein n=1 Tax=Mytilus coruscus TaxID=42192 RepID=A0A6J8DAU9_MYTCO|nr:unnamed protein product [Mytilus coruscus]
MLDMTTDQFLLGFRRFVARCGTPIQIISDNALQFKAASNVVQQEWEKVLNDSDIQNYVSNKGISWKFIVELTPWMGGFYERLVGLAKRSLRKTIGKVCLSVEQLRTLLTEVEAVVNSRPLAYIGEDIDSNIVLTPSCFLTLNKHTGIPERINNDDDPEYKPQFSSTDNLLELWKKGQKHLNRFWKVWRDDYLLSIRERTTVKLKEKRVRSTQYPQIGDIVLIKDDLPRGMWKIGKIINLSKSSDEQCRSAKVLLPSKKTLNRTLNFLYPLECHDDNVEQTDNVNNVEQNSKCETQTSSTRPQRRAAEQAKQKIHEWTS